MIYGIVPITTSRCDCEDCRAGKFLFDLQSFRDGEWCWSGMTLVSYANVEDCRLHHDWGIQFPPGATWEDGTPIVPPKEEPRPIGPARGEAGFIDPSSLQPAIRSLSEHCTSQGGG